MEFQDAVVCLQRRPSPQTLCWGFAAALLLFCCSSPLASASKQQTPLDEDGIQTIDYTAAAFVVAALCVVVAGAFFFFRSRTAAGTPER